MIPNSALRYLSQYSDWAMGWVGVRFLQGLGIFLFTTVSRLDLGPTQPPVQLIPVSYPG